MTTVIPDQPHNHPDQVLRYSAFTSEQGGGNPAGVVLDASGMDGLAMQAIAAELGYSETAFLLPRGERRFAVRYFSPLAEVAFCGHATVGATVAFAERHGIGDVMLDAQVGEIHVTTVEDNGIFSATLTSVEPQVSELPGVDALLDVLGWDAADLDPELPPRLAFAGLNHPVISAASRERLASLHYDFAALKELMEEQRWGTIFLVHRENTELFHVRNPFPIGGVVEDPATGAAAAAFGGYLRGMGLIDSPAKVVLLQGEDMGQPCLLRVEVPERGGILVTGSAASLNGRV